MKNKRTCDIVVVGGGPAGSTAAYLLAGNGFEVCLLDKKAFPRPKLCAGLLTWKTIDLLERIFNLSLTDLKARKVIINACRHYRIFHGPKELVSGRLDFPFHFVDRKSYDHFWLNSARNAGAEVMTSKAVTEIDANHCVVTTADGERIQARMIIGADGVWSKARKALSGGNASNPRWQNNLAMTIETRQPCAQPPPYASLHFGFVSWGYGWSFPNPTHRIIGLGSLPNEQKQALTQGYADLLNSLGLVPEDTRPWQGYPLPYGNYLDPPGRGRVLLVGDACGLADPLLGEGIYYAHRSGELAARAIMASGPQFRHVDRIYCKALNHHLLRELRWIKFYRNLLFFGGRHRRYRGLKLLFRLFPKRLEATVQGQCSFARLWF